MGSETQDPVPKIQDRCRTWDPKPKTLKLEHEASDSRSWTLVICGLEIQKFNQDPKKSP